MGELTNGLQSEKSMAPYAPLLSSLFVLTTKVGRSYMET